MKFPIEDFFSKCDQTLNGKLHFLCSERGALMKNVPDSMPVILCFYGFDSPKVKWDMISSIIDFVYGLPHELPNDLKLRIF